MVVLFGHVQIGGFREKSSLRPYLMLDEEGVQDIKSVVFARIQILNKYASSMMSVEGTYIIRDFELEIVSRTLKS